MPGARSQELGKTRRPEARVHYLDWLRAGAVLGVFLFHAVHPFDTFGWHVKNPESSEIVSLVIIFLFPWGLGFFFLIAGAGSYLATRFRSSSAYVSERMRRLLVPYLVGFALLSPVQAFIEEVHKDDWEGSFWAFIPHFFARAWRELPFFDGELDPLPLGWSYHLWFLAFLLWFALLGLPIFVWLGRPRVRRALDRLASWSHRRGSTLLFAIPIALAHVALRARFPDEHDWGEFVYYFAFFVTGYVLMSDERFRAAARRDLVPALALGLAGFLGLMAADAVSWAEEWAEAPTYSWAYFLFFFLFSSQAWGWALAALSLGMRAMPLRRPLPASIGQAAMPFFVLHQPVILAIAFFVVGTNFGIPLKLLAVVVSSFLSTLALTIVMTRYGALRLLLGVKPSRNTSPA